MDSTPEAVSLPPPLTKSQIASLRAVKNGADVLSRVIAMDLREIQKHYPSYVDIGPRQGRYSGVDQLPYFGAILTAAGRKAIAKARP